MKNLELKTIGILTFGQGFCILFLVIYLFADSNKSNTTFIS
jgi:hypothetical protein